MSTIVSIVLGGFITILTAIAVEYFRKPKLKITIEHPPLDRTDATGKFVSRHLRLSLENQVSPIFAPWMQRASAIRCRGEITFHHLEDGQAVYDRSMVVRWVNSPEPLTTVQGTTLNIQFSQPVLYTFRLDSNIDVYPGEEEKLDVAVRFDGEQECYGWNNTSYLHDWRTLDWKLKSGRYLVRVVITSAGQKCEGLFRLINDVENLKDFRLIEAQPDDEARPFKLRTS